MKSNVQKYKNLKIKNLKLKKIKRFSLSNNY